MSLEPADFVDGPLCPPCGNVPTCRVHKDHPNFQGPPYHDCPRRPEKTLAWILIHIGSLTSSRFDQHLRYQFGDVATNDLLEWLERNAVEIPQR